MDDVIRLDNAVDTCARKSIGYAQFLHSDMKTCGFWAKIRSISTNWKV